MKLSTYRLHRGCFLYVGLMVVSGCQFSTGQPAAREAEPNGEFAIATPLGPVGNAGVTVNATMQRFSDVDVFNLGAARAGDEVNVQVLSSSSLFRPLVALYDEDGELINEQRDTAAGQSPRTLQLQHSVRTDADSLYVAVSNSVTSMASGDYELSVNVDRNRPLLSAKSQTVLLDFSGGDVDIPLAGDLVLDPFDAGDIDEVYEGQTDRIKEIIKQTVLQNYRRFDLLVLDSDHDAPSPDEPMAHIYFGGYSRLAFGVADRVDLYNLEPDDDAIVFTESFTPATFTFQPTVDQLAVAIGNVASHELGHLLGLNHVRDPEALMDESSPAFTLVFDQEFESSPLAPSVFRIGRQNSVELLDVIVGPTPQARTRLTQPDLDIDTGPQPSLTIDSGSATAPLGKCLNYIAQGAPGNVGTLATPHR